MLRCAVTFVRRESITRIFAVERLDHVVALGLGDDRRRGDAEVDAIALVKTVLWNHDAGDCACIDEHVLPRAPQHVLVDARTVPGIMIPQNSFNKGDGINFSIAAASIIAKTERDHMIEALDREYPGYGFATHKGYGTPEHRAALKRLGPSPMHRMSFPVISELRGEFSPLFYELRVQLFAASTRPALNEFETAVRVHAEHLAEQEY